MLQVVLESDVPVVLMHMQGTPKDMQVAPQYEDVVAEILGFFRERINYLTSQGVAVERLIIDPGIGFGKKLEHNLCLLRNLDQLVELGPPVLLAHSRKRFLGEIAGIEEEQSRDLATAVVTALCRNSGIAMVRVHNVAATRQALDVAEALAA
jgi:dihydropteroate synthase